MEEIIIQIARFIGYLLLDLLSYYTARVILPLVSLGFLQVQPLSAKNHATWWWQRSFKRLPSGRIEVAVPMASMIGFLLFWSILLGIVLRYETG